MKRIGVLILLAMTGVGWCQTAHTAPGSCENVCKPLAVWSYSPTALQDPYGRIFRAERIHGLTVSGVTSVGRTVAYVGRAAQPQGTLLVRDPGGQVVERIRPLPCGRWELVIDKCGRVVEKRKVLPRGTVVIQVR